MGLDDPFADTVRRLPWLEHERRHRQREGELRNRAIEPEPWQRTEEDGRDEPTVVLTDCGCDDCAFAIVLLQSGLFDLGDLS